MQLAVFDLDKTLIAADSDYGWGRFLIHKNVVDAQWYEQRNRGFMRLYDTGELQMTDYIVFVADVLNAVGAQRTVLLQEYMETVVQYWIYPELVERIAQHRAAGDDIIIVSASNMYLVKAAAQLFDVDAAFGTMLAQVAGRFTGKILGTATFNVGKCVVVEQWFAAKPDLSYANTWFYSDSINDLPLLQRVAHPVVVNPDAALQKYCSTWERLDLPLPKIATQAVIPAC